MYYKNVSDGYITRVGTGIGDCEIDENEYKKIIESFKSRPIPPSGYDCKLATNYEWEMYELPPTEPTEEQATESDYQNALAEMGVNLNG